MIEKILAGAAASFSAALAIIGVKHLMNSDIHVKSKDVAFRDVCEERSKRIEEKVDDLKETVCQEFRDVKRLINGARQ